jgi:hypothetical protein
VLVVLGRFDALIALVGHDGLADDEASVVEVLVLNAKPADFAPSPPALPDEGAVRVPVANWLKGDLRMGRI